MPWQRMLFLLTIQLQKKLTSCLQFKGCQEIIQNQYTTMKVFKDCLLVMKMDCLK